MYELTRHLHTEQRHLILILWRNNLGRNIREFIIVSMNFNPMSTLIITTQAFQSGVENLEHLTDH